MTRNESVIRAFKIIEYLADKHRWVRLQSIAKDLDIAPSTTHRFLTSLRDAGYVQQNSSDSRYRASLKLAWLSSKVIEGYHLVQVARPFMAHLTSISNETTHLAVLEDLEIVYVAKVDGNQAVQMRSRTGVRGHVHSTAVGKAILAFLPDNQIEEIMESVELTQQTPNTILDKNKLRKQLEVIRENGYATDYEENEKGIRCVGAPIFDHTSAVVGSVSLSGWNITMTKERIPQLALEVVDISKQISRELGFYPNEE